MRNSFQEIRAFSHTILIILKIEEVQPNRKIAFVGPSNNKSIFAIQSQNWTLGDLPQRNEMLISNFNFY